ncbi:hypothetical protein O3G_MSEX014956, partial [Manduca sexta]
MGCCGECCVPPKESREPIRYDPDFKGPVHNRSCTDIIWLILFILFLGVWGYVGYYSITRGNIENLLAPIDSKGRRCGLDSGLEDKKYLVFFDISKCLSPDSPIVGCSTPQVCVSKCPERFIRFGTELTPATMEQLRSSMVCTDDVNVRDMTHTQAMQYIKENKCAPYVLQSQPVISRCIGDLSTIQCKGATTPSSKAFDSESGSVCVRNTEEARKSLLNRATVLDTYLGWISASWVTTFTRNERETHVVVLFGRCFVNVTQVVTIMEEETTNIGLDVDEMLTQISQLVQFNQLSAQIVQDLEQSRWYLAGALVFVVIICFIYILLLRWVVVPVVWVSIAGLFGLLGFSLYLCYKNYEYYRDNPVGLYQTTNLKGYAESIFSKKETWMALLVAGAILLLILLLVVIFLRNRISIATALIREGSKAVTSIKSTIFFPIFPWVLQCVVMAYGVFIFMLILSIGENAFGVANIKNDTTCDCGGLYTESCDPATFALKCRDTAGGACKMAICHFTGINNPHSVVYLHLINLLGFFWTLFFISGVSDMILASTFSRWYWTFHKKDLPFFTLTSGIFQTLRYHLGTVAFGALIIAIVRVIRVILEYIDHKLKKFDNPLSRAIMCCCKCFFWCLESFLKFINKNAYIMCAVHGHSF